MQSSTDCLPLLSGRRISTPTSRPRFWRFRERQRDGAQLRCVSPPPFPRSCISPQDSPCMRAPCPTSSLPPLPCLADTGASDDGPSCWGAVSDRPPDPYVRCRARYKYLQFVSPPRITGGKRVRPQPGAPCTTSPHHHLLHRRSRPSLPSIHLHSPPLPTASLLPPPPFTPRGNLSGGPVACHSRQLVPPPPARRPCGSSVFLRF